MYAKDIILELGDKLNLGKLEPDENGVCSLVFDGIHAVDFKISEDGDEVQIFSPVAPIPEKNREELLSQLNEANLFGQGTGGALFSILKEIDLLFMYRKFRMDVTDYQHFEKGVESFLNYLEAWKKKLEAEFGTGDTSGLEAPKAPTTAPTSGPGGMQV